MEHCNYGYWAGVPGQVQTQGVYIHIVYLQTKNGFVLFGVIRDDPIEDDLIFFANKSPTSYGSREHSFQNCYGFP
jgi:hypothetical protein